MAKITDAESLIQVLRGLEGRVNRHTRSCVYGHSIGDEGDACTCGKKEAREDLQEVIAAISPGGEFTLVSKTQLANALTSARSEVKSSEPAVKS